MSNSKGIGRFTAENIVAIITAIPETNGTYEAVAEEANRLGANIAPNTIANWVATGNADIRAKKTSTAYARFAKRYAELTSRHCNPDDNRNRELDRALNTLGNQCECGKPKGKLPNGRTAPVCNQCADLDQNRPKAA